MSDQKKSRKKKLNVENSVSSFIDKKPTEDASDEPLRKKNKLLEEAAASSGDDSLKFFKHPEKIISQSSASKNSKSSVSEFINKPTTSKQSAKKSTTKGKRAAKSKAHGDIRKALSKQEKMLYHAVTDTNSQDGIDPYEMQLARAISESLKEMEKSSPKEPTVNEGNRFENPFTSTGKIQSINSVLERYGFKSKKVYSDYEIELIMNSNKSKRSKYQKVPTLLTNTSENKRSEMIRQKVDDVLNSNLFAELENQEFPKFYPIVYSPYLLELHTIYGTTFKKSSTENMILSDYYVTELFEPSNVKAGHLLKDWKTIIGRDPSPEKSHSKNQTPEDEKESKDFENECGDKSSSSRALSMNSSCSDIFDGVEDFSLDEIDDALEQAQNEDIPMKTVSDHLDLLHERMSQSIVTVCPEEKENNEEEEIKIDLTQECDSDATENYSYDMHATDKVDLTQNAEPVREEIFDLTQHAEPVNEEICNLTQHTEPAKEEIFNLTQHIEPVNGEICDLTQHTEPVNGEICDLTQHAIPAKEEVFDLTHHTEPAKENIYDLTQSPKESSHASERNSKSSFDENEVICISDEEINYSINRFEEEENDVNDNFPTQYQENNDCGEDVLEIDNLVEQSLIDVIANDENVRIDNSVSDLLSNYSLTNRQSLGYTRKNRSIRFLENENFDDSIADIMKKYGVLKTPQPPKNKSFAKIQSESDLDKVLNHSIEKSFDNQSVDDDKGGNSADLSIINEDYSSQNDSREEENADGKAINLSINKSLANILDSPMIKETDISVAKTKPITRKSLGIVMNDKYMIDTETFFSEPDFLKMTPNELKHELFKYGIRPLPVKKAVALLTHIYNQIHPKICVAIDEEIDVNDSRREMNITDIVTDIGMKGDQDEFVFQLDSAGILDDEEYILPKMKKTKVPTCLIPFHISFYNMIRSNDKLQKYILEFRPLDLDQIYKHFRKFGLTYQLNDIIAFLDRRCITFKTAEKSYSKRHERKKQKRTQKSTT